MISTALCVDIGTSSLKTALIDSAGNVYAYSFVRFGKNEKKNPEIWIYALHKAVKKLFVQLKNRQKIEIASICVSGNGPTLAAENFLHLWNEPPYFSDSLYAEFAPSLFVPRLAYIKRTFSSMWNKSEYIFSGPEYVIYRLCGNACTILPEKRFESAYWNKELLLKAGIKDEKLPPFVEPGFCAGFLTDEAAQKIGLVDMFDLNKDFSAKQIRVICGAPDFIVALIGTNTLRSGLWCDRAGSSEGINVCTQKPVIAKEIRTLPSIMPNLFNAGILLPQEHSVSKKAELVEQAVTVLKKACGFEPSVLRVTGGQAQNQRLNELKSSLLKIPVEICFPAAELMGDAVLAFYSLGVYSSIQEAADAMVKVTKRIEPFADIIAHS